MIRRESVANTIERLERRIALALKGKRKISGIIKELEKKYKKKLINYDDYLFEKKREIDGRSAEEWIEYYDSYIKFCRREIRIWEKKISKKKFFVGAGVLVFFILVSFVIFSYIPNFAGFVVQNQDGSSDSSLESSSLDDIESGDSGGLNEESKSVIGSEESPEVNEGVYDDFISDSKETGDSNFENSEVDNVDNKNESLDSEEMITKSDVFDEGINNSVAKIVNNSKDVGNISGSSDEKVFVENISLDNVSVIKNRSEGNISSETENISLDDASFKNASIDVETIQYRAVIGRPVKWLKKINASKKGSLVVALPKGSGNISVLTGDKISEAEENVKDYYKLVNESDKGDLVSGVLTGNVVVDVRKSEGILTRFWRWLTGFRISGNVILEENISEDVVIKGDVIEVNLSKVASFEDEVGLEYYTEAPESVESKIKNGKRIVVSASSEYGYKDILAYSELSREVKRSDILFYHVVNGKRILENFSAFDLNKNGLIDYIEWDVDHLSSQTYELIIKISRASVLDLDRKFLRDVYENIRTRNDVWEIVGDGEFLRVGFEKNLTRDRDITIFPRVISGNPKLEIYEKDGNNLIAEFSSVVDDEYNKVFLDGLDGEQDVFDLKVVGGVVEFDHVVDPLTRLDIGTWTDTLGTFDATPTRDSWVGVPFNNEVSASIEYSQNANDIDIDLVSGGKYLVLYNLQITSDYNNRLGWETRLTVGGNAVPGSYASCYQRNTANDDAICGAGAIINASAGDDVRVELVYRTNLGNQVATLVANHASLQIVKLDDDWDYLRLTKNSNQQQSVAGTWSNFSWENELEKDSSFTHSVNSDVIGLDAGHYLVIAGSAWTSGSSSGRVAMVLRSLINGNPSPYGRSYAFSRGANDHREVDPWAISIIDVAASTDYVLQYTDSQVETAITSNTNEENMGLQIVKLPDSANYYRAYGNSARDPTASSSSPVKFDAIDVEDEEDSAFSGNAANGDITIQPGYEGDYLFLFGGTGTRTSTSSTRSIPYMEWYKDGSSVNLGGMGSYTRGSQGSYDSFEGGFSGGVVIQDSGTSTFNIYGYTLGQDPNQDRLDANEFGIMAVRLDDFIFTGNLPPSVSLDSPADEYMNVSSLFVDLTFNASVSDDRDLDNCSLWHNATGNWHLNSTQSVSGTNDVASFDLNGFSNVEFIWNIECTDNEGVSSFSSNNRSVRIVFGGNIPPTNPSPKLNSSDGSNHSYVDLNCFDDISDGDGDSLNVSVVWYRDGNEVWSFDYNDSFASGNDFIGILKAGNISVGESWKCGMRLFDGEDFSDWVNSSEVVILNGIPTHGTPILNSSSGNNLTNEALTCYNLSTFDGDGDVVRNIVNWERNSSSLFLALLPFEGGSTNSFTQDYSGRLGYNLSVVASWNRTGGWDGFGAYEFNGVNQYINLDNSGVSSVFDAVVVNRTYFLKYKANSVNGTVYRVLFEEGGGTNGLNIYIHDSRIYAGAWSESDSWNGNWTSFVTTSGVWHSVALVFDGGNNLVSTYYDGVLNSSYAHSQVAGHSGDDFLGYVGDNSVASPNSGSDLSFGNYFSGVLDDFMVFDRALSKAQLDNLANGDVNIMASGETKVGDVFKCSIIPNDGVANGKKLTSNSLSVLEDNYSPSFFYFKNYPVEPVFYNVSKNYEFNVSIDNSNGTVGIDFDGINHSVGVVGNEYFYDVTGLDAGVYDYYWWTYSGDGNLYFSSEQKYIVNKSSTTVNLTLRGVRGNISVNQSQDIEVRCEVVLGEASGIIRLFREGVEVNSGSIMISNLTSFDVLGVENLTCVYEESGNFLTSSETWFVNVSNFPPSAPTDLTCNGGNCDIEVNDGVNLRGLGSVDEDNVTYFLEARLKQSDWFGNSSDYSFFGNGGAGVNGTSQTCSGVWGWDCSTGPPETGGNNGDNTYDSCGTGTGNDESVEQIYLNVTSVSPGDAVEVICEYDPYAFSDSSYISYYNGSAWIKIFKHVNWGSTSNTNESVVFIVNNSLGVHWVRCSMEYVTTENNGPCYTGGSYYDNDDINFTVISAGSGVSTEQNSSWISYDSLGENKSSLNNIKIIIGVDSYNPSGSIAESTNKPDLFLEVYTGSGWYTVGELGLSNSYSSNSLDNTDRNFSVIVNDSGILNAWEDVSNQDIRIKAVFLDYSNSSARDEINYSNVWISLNILNWSELGNHSEGADFYWNTSELPEQSCVSLRARAVDLDGSDVYSDYFNKGNCLNISRGVSDNKIPKIYVDSVVSQNPIESGTRRVDFDFGVYDEDGESDVNVSAVSLTIEKNGESSKVNNSCVQVASGSNWVNFSCSVEMAYYDASGSWTIRVFAGDLSGANVENSSVSFIYNKLTAMTMSLNALSWDSVNIGGSNYGANNDPIIVNNTGNDENLRIRVRAYDLQGEVVSTDYIYAENFSVGVSGEGCSGDLMINGSGVVISGSDLDRNTSEEIFFCLRGVPANIISQDYSSSGFGGWEIRIVLVVLSGRRRKKKKKGLRKDRLVSALGLIAEELKEKYSLSSVEAVNVLTEELMDKLEVSCKEVRIFREEEKLEIPLKVFACGELGALEAVVKYMKENLGMKYSKIGETINRDQRTVWTAYKKGSNKVKDVVRYKKGEMSVPVSVFSGMDGLTVLESVVLYLKDKGLRYSEIGDLLGRDQRNIWGVCRRAEGKILK